MKSQILSVDLPRIDGDTQSRVSINEDVVTDYADIITAAGTEWPFPPLDVFHNGTEYFMADGFHRFLAAHRTKRGSFPCRIHAGSAIDARIFGMTANDTHGLRMSREDKRACVEWLLDNGGKLTQKAIGAKAGVGISTVRNIVADRLPTSTSKEKAKRKKGNLPFDPPSVEVDTASPPKPPTTPTEPTTPTTPDSTENASDANEAFAEATEEPETTSTASTSSGTPPRQIDKSAWYKIFQQQMAPLVRIVDKIANGVGKKHGPHHEAIQEQLNYATEEMQKLLGVK